MISAADVPTIEGDMDVLAAHARTLDRVGTEFADTGARIHSTWQGLGAVYSAPEAAELLMATAPVQQVSASLGEDIRAVGAILGTYAEEVRAIQARLGTMRLQAGMLEAEPVPDENRGDGIVDGVNAAMAEFDDAQRRAANAINALSGTGPTYRPADDDGRTDPDEYGAALPATGPTGADIGHTVLDVVGLVPLAGEIADGANALWYAVDGDDVNAGLSAAAMIPMVGWASTGGKLGVKGYKAVHSLDGLKAFLRNRPTIVPAHAERLPVPPGSFGVRYRWFEDGKRITVHARGDATRGPVYRVKNGNNTYLDKYGRAYPSNKLNPRIPSYDPKIADRTHIGYPADQPRPDRNHVRVVAPNPAGIVGEDR
jgi:Bacterial toxin 30